MLQDIRPEYVPDTRCLQYEALKSEIPNPGSMGDSPFLSGEKEMSPQGHYTKCPFYESEKYLEKMRKTLENARGKSATKNETLEHVINN